MSSQDLPVDQRALRVVGLNHHHATLHQRERAAVPVAALPEALGELGSGVILSTCNRTEVYRLGAPNDNDDPTERFFARRLDGVSPRPPLYRLEHTAALRHLFTVASGLDSLVLGEAQILGQVRAAIEAARTAGSADERLVRVFHHALRVGRRARAETFIGRHAVSVSYAAVVLARSILGSLRGAGVLLVGAGEMGELTAKVVSEHGGVVVGVANRTVANAEALVARVGGQALGLDQLPEAIPAADIVISSTDAPEYVVTRDAVAQGMRKRERRPLLVLDIAVPRDVDPAVREISGVHLVDLDDLRAHCEHNQATRRNEAAAVERIIDVEVERFWAWWETLPALPSIVALRQDAEEVRIAELDEALSKLGNLRPEDRAIVDGLSRAIVNKLLHGPTVRLKELASAGRLQEIEQLRAAFARER